MSAGQEKQRRREPDLADIRPDLWNADITPDTYTGDRDRYQSAVMDQYKLYVEMADRISSRRGLTNTFFLTLNTLIFTLFGVLWKDRPPEISTSVLILLLVVTLGQAVAWWALVRSYRQLNGAKYKVVALLEERLPASPFWSAEWTALGKGRDPRLYLPLSHVEQWVPVLFAAVYVLAFVLAVTG